MPLLVFLRRQALPASDRKFPTSPSRILITSRYHFTICSPPLLETLPPRALYLSSTEDTGDRFATPSYGVSSITWANLNHGEFGWQLSVLTRRRSRGIFLQNWVIPSRFCRIPMRTRFAVTTSVILIPA